MSASKSNLTPEEEQVHQFSGDVHDEDECWCGAYMPRMSIIDSSSWFGMIPRTNNNNGVGTQDNERGQGRPELYANEPLNLAENHNEVPIERDSYIIVGNPVDVSRFEHTQDQLNLDSGSSTIGSESKGEPDASASAPIDVINGNSRINSCIQAKLTNGEFVKWMNYELHYLEPGPPKVTSFFINATNASGTGGDADMEAEDALSSTFQVTLRSMGTTIDLAGGCKTPSSTGTPPPPPESLPESIPPKEGISTVSIATEDILTAGEDNSLNAEKESPAEQQPPPDDSSLAEKNPPVVKSPLVEKNPPVERNLSAEHISDFGKDSSAEMEPPVEKNPPAEMKPQVEKNPPAEMKPPVEKNPPAEMKPQVEKNPPAEMEPQVEKNPPAEMKPPVEKNPPAEMTPLIEKTPLVEKNSATGNNSETEKNPLAEKNSLPEKNSPVEKNLPVEKNPPVKKNSHVEKKSPTAVKNPPVGKIPPVASSTNTTEKPRQPVKQTNGTNATAKGMGSSGTPNKTASSGAVNKKSTTSTTTPTKAVAAGNPPAATGSPARPSSRRASAPQTPTTPSDDTNTKKLPMNKVKVGTAPSPNIKEVKSKIGSLTNSGSSVAAAAAPVAKKSTASTVKIPEQKLNWNATSKVGSFNTTYVRKGGDVKVKQVEPKKVEVKEVTSKVGSWNAAYKPGGGEKKIFDDKQYMKKTHSNASSEHVVSDPNTPRPTSSATNGNEAPSSVTEETATPGVNSHPSAPDQELIDA